MVYTLAIMYNNNKEIVSSKLFKVFRKLSKINSMTRNYGTNELLYEAEVRVIKAVKENEGIHVTALAEMLGVTKGAVSHSLVQLEKKGMIIKQPDSSNQSRLLLKLTEKGDIAYNSHEKLHEEINNIIELMLADESIDFENCLSDFLSKLDKVFTDFIKE